MGYGLFQGLTYSFSPMVYCFLSKEANLNCKNLKQVCYVLQQESNLFLHVLRAYFLTLARHFRKESKELLRLDKIPNLLAELPRTSEYFLIIGDIRVP